MESLSVDMEHLGMNGDAGSLGTAEAAAVALATSVVQTPAEIPPEGLGFQTNGGDSSGEHERVEGKLFIGGISWQTTEDSLRAYFQKYGEVADVALMKDKYSGQPRGFGFIRFQEPSVLDTILSQQHSIDGRTVDVKLAVPKSEAPGPQRPIHKPTENNKIFVGGLAPAVTVEDFRKYFEGYGAVSDAVVMVDRVTQRSRGFGFVTFESDAVVEEVLNNTHEVVGKMVEVKRAEPKESRTKFNNLHRGGLGGTNGYMGGPGLGLGVGGAGMVGGYNNHVNARHNLHARPQQMYMPRGAPAFGMYGGYGSAAALAAAAAAYGYGYGGYSAYAAPGAAGYPPHAAYAAGAAAGAAGGAYQRAGTAGGYGDQQQAAARQTQPYMT